MRPVAQNEVEFPENWKFLLLLAGLQVLGAWTMKKKGCGYENMAQLFLETHTLPIGATKDITEQINDAWEAPQGRLLCRALLRGKSPEAGQTSPFITVKPKYVLDEFLKEKA